MKEVHCTYPNLGLSPGLFTTNLCKLWKELLFDKTWGLLYSLHLMNLLASNYNWACFFNRVLDTVYPQLYILLEQDVSLKKTH